MAKKSRKRRGQGPQQPAAAGARARPRARSSSASPDERPPAPWGDFPLSELLIFLGLVMFVAGLFIGGRRGVIMIGTGLVLASLAGLEVSIREHFAGYRSHSSLLAGALAVATMVILVVAGGTDLSAAIRLGVPAAVFGLAFWSLRAVFKRRSGGLSFRVGGFR